jgi:hypothetical protein
MMRLHWGRSAGTKEANERLESNVGDLEEVNRQLVQVADVLRAKVDKFKETVGDE